MFCIVQVIIDMFVTPKLMGKAMGMNPAILLLSLSVWGKSVDLGGRRITQKQKTIIMAYWTRYISGENETENDVQQDGSGQMVSQSEP